MADRTRSSDSIPRRLMTIGLLLIAGLAGGCVTDNVTTNDSRPMPPTPQAAPRVPESARANTVVMWLSARPADTNGNGFPDLIIAETYLFAQPYPTPMYEPGAFVISMYPAGQSDQPGVKPLRQWRIEGPELQQRRLIARFGPAYNLQLSLLADGSDRLPLTGADLIGEFQPADGRPSIRTRGVSWIQIGRQVADGHRGGNESADAH